MSAIVWFRTDLRLSDNPALNAAVETGHPVIPAFIWSPEEEKEWEMGSASRWWLHESLKALIESLEKKRLRLILRRGDTLKELRALVKDTEATAVFWNRRYEPLVIQRDRDIKQSLTEAGVAAHSFNGILLFEPWEIENKQKRPFQVFTPFWKHCLKQPTPPPPTLEPSAWPVPKAWPRSLRLPELDLQPKIDWTKGMRANWIPGEAGAKEALKRFLKSPVEDYSLARDIPGRIGTSRLSPYLHFGEVSPRQVWDATKRGIHAKSEGAKTFLKELGWREFAYHLLFHFPQTPQFPLREAFQNFPWERNKKHLQAWQKGRTGYPLVDAGMRELWHTGWMHNRVRMIAGSFLVKHLLQPWQEGAQWFWDTLVDADLANNTLGWQWVGGCGADAAPYFRVFNPVLQGEKFDPKGEYVKKWVPELASVPSQIIHRPWENPALLAKAGVVLGRDYPKPIIDHNEGRQRALEAYMAIKQKSI